MEQKFIVTKSQLQKLVEKNSKVAKTDDEKFKVSGQFFVSVDNVNPAYTNLWYSNVHIIRLRNDSDAAKPLLKFLK